MDLRGGAADVSGFGGAHPLAHHKHFFAHALTPLRLSRGLAEGGLDGLVRAFQAGSTGTARIVLATDRLQLLAAHRPNRDGLPALRQEAGRRKMIGRAAGSYQKQNPIGKPHW